jgi:hypothetical protein
MLFLSKMAIHICKKNPYIALALKKKKKKKEKQNAYLIGRGAQKKGQKCPLNYLDESCTTHIKWCNYLSI